MSKLQNQKGMTLLWVASLICCLFMWANMADVSAAATCSAIGTMPQFSCQTPSTPHQDRRTNKEVVSVVAFNAEWLFYSDGNGGNQHLFVRILITWNAFHWVARVRVFPRKESNYHVHVMSHAFDPITSYFVRTGKNGFLIISGKWLYYYYSQWRPRTIAKMSCTYRQRHMSLD